MEPDLSLPLPESHAGGFSSLYRRMSAAERFAFRPSLSGAQKGQGRANWLKLIGSFSTEREHFYGGIHIAIQARTKYFSDAAHQLYRSPEPHAVMLLFPPNLSLFLLNISLFPVIISEFNSTHSLSNNVQTIHCCFLYYNNNSLKSIKALTLNP